MKAAAVNIADLYIRVSTDEQADKGYSQRNQEEMLRKYCMGNSIEIRQVIYEDHSAKSFNRPQWKKLLLFLRKHRNKSDLILFTKWDRFSRNAGDAYQMINVLRGYGVEPQAIEQPLDLSIPENKMMLAFYLAAPEVENDRRALNVFYGMRRAKKEGRYMGLAPVGYANKVDESGRKYIVPKEPDATLIRSAFTELSKGVFNTRQIWKKTKDAGLKCSKNAFWQLIRNPLYCGKIFIPKFKDEDCYFVKGQHEAIVSETLFEKVQDVLDGRSRSYRSKIDSLNEFPLKGFFICPVCGKPLTGSKSKGRNRYYAYYHCYKGCSYRISTETLHRYFQQELARYIPRKEIFDCYRSILSETYRDCTKDLHNEKRKLEGRISDYAERTRHIMDLLATQKIDAEDYSEMKDRYRTELAQLEKELAGVSKKLPPFEGLPGTQHDQLLNLEGLMDGMPCDELRMVIAKLFPGKLIFTGDKIQPKALSVILRSVYRYEE